jgi:aspartate racemase
LIADLQLGKIEGVTEQLAAIAKTSFERQFKTQRPVVCLACTELPAAFQKLKSLPYFEVDGVLYINTTIVHADAAFDFAVDVK